MIKKPREIPSKLVFLERVLNRLPVNHHRRSEFEREVMRRRSGYEGELELDYQLRLIEDEGFMTFNDLRLQYNGIYFQMDTLLLSPFFIILIDAKSFSGTLHFDPLFNQLIRTYDHKDKRYADPILQGKRHSALFHSWLKKHKFPEIPSEYLVSISNPHAILHNPSKNQEVYRTICPAAKIPFRIQELKKKHRVEILSHKELLKISHKLLKNHEPLSASFESIKLDRSDLIQGVQCPKCESFGMKRTHGSWICGHCSHKDPTAHFKALEDYFILFGPQISNFQLREFLQFDSRQTATRLLKSLSLQNRQT